MQTGKRVNKLNGKGAVNLKIGILVVFNRIELNRKKHTIDAFIFKIKLLVYRM